MKKIHIVGIEGAGTSALAVLYKRKGDDVSGSDDGDHFYAPALKREGIFVHGSFDAGNVPEDADLLVYSTAFQENPEIDRARERGIPTLSYPEAVGELTKEKLSLLVSGTHGKTTTSAMLAETMRVAGADPSAIIGGRVRGWKGNTLLGSGPYFVLEADEYQNKLRFYHPLAAILTSADWDHPDFFPDKESYVAVFREFVTRIPRHGVLVYCNDSSEVVGIAKEASCLKVSYGFHADSDVRIVDYVVVSPEESGPDGPRQRFGIVTKDGRLGEFSLRLAGRHNAENAASIIALSLFLKLDIDSVKKALSEFSGTERRFEYVGSRRGVPVYDDYAHHPEEIRATLAAFRGLYPSRKILVVFHPHTFSRTEALLSQFAQSFDDADKVFVLDVYGSAREKVGAVSSVDLVREINRYAPEKSENVHSMDDAFESVSGILEENDLIVTVGAGDVWRVAKRLIGDTEGTIS